MTTTKDEIEKIIEEFINRKSRCIATDGDYSDKEMVEILSNHIKNSFEEDLKWLESKLSSLSTHIRGEMVEELEGMKLQIGSGVTCELCGSFERCKCSFYNQAIDDIISKL